MRQGGGGGGGDDDPTSRQLIEQKAADVLEAQLGWPLFTEGDDRLGWLLNFTTTSFEDKDTGQTMSAVDCYFQCQDGSMFKARVPYAPYFYLQVKDDAERDVEVWLRRKFEARIRDVELVLREDLDLKNHLSGLKRRLLKVSFHNVQQLMDVRREVAPVVAANARRGAMADADVLECIVGMREYDVPYHVRFAIDTDTRAGHWYTVRAQDGVTSLTHRPDLLQRAEPVICAFDIETTKLPLRFPNAAYDQVFMISYMVDRRGYLMVNRAVVGADVADFEYRRAAPQRRGGDRARARARAGAPGARLEPPPRRRAARAGRGLDAAAAAAAARSPKPEFEGPFTVINEPDEPSLLRTWFAHMREVKPGIMVTYNGDFFDFPFIEARAAAHGLDMAAELGFKISAAGGECLSRACVHMDCLHWAVTKAKLGYDPVEVAPEDMVRLAGEAPQAMASYSVSDAVATYYLYMTYIHPFIFSLATIIPMPPDEVLRKGSGTLCEQLLMVEAYRANVICPNKHTSQARARARSRARGAARPAPRAPPPRPPGPRAARPAPPCARAAQSEVLYRNHLLESETYIGGKVEALESGVFRSDLPTRFKASADAYAGLIAHLDRDLTYALTHEAGEEVPLIYHLDVAAMYPNIILTNRLQPAAIVGDEDCAACDFNRPGKTCLRTMEWVYKRVLDKPVVERRAAGICQRENSFYIDTVRAFRDRRYEYKGLNKKWKGKLDAARRSGNALAVAEASDMVVLYDSLQLAHKCILNSFYGYVMRKGARWYSMEMAGVVTHTGAAIIQRACEMVEQLGKPLELDTDGIWCCLPGSFPENFEFKHRGSGKGFKISYPCVMLNVMVAQHNTNDQYQTLVDPARQAYETSSQMSIEFEAMILPASKEEGKLIKKRYARRGELKLIKVFQAEVFEQFLAGASLAECYDAGVDLTDEELMEYISESTTMSKAMEDYGDRKSCAITTAKRLSAFLGDERIKDKGLNCTYIIARRPESQPTSERAIPCSIFSAEPPVARAWLRKWCGDIGSAGGDAERVPDVRDILDWDYYRERLGNAVQKIITIPAAMQAVPNPVPRVKHPDWLHKLVRRRRRRPRRGARRGAARGGGGGGAGSLTRRARPACRAAAGPGGGAGGEAGKPPAEPMPDRVTDYAAWVAWHKARWRAGRTERKKRRTDAGRRGGGAAEQGDAPLQVVPTSNVGRFFKQQQAAAAASHWQLLQLAPTSTPGLFKLWALVDAALFCIPLRVRRTVLVNCDAPLSLPLAATGGGQELLAGLAPVAGGRVWLPPGDVPRHLYQLTAPEAEWQSHANALGLGLLSAGARAVYQSQLPLSLAAALDLGCVATVTPGARARGRTLGQGFDLEELQSKTATECPYLEGGGPDGLGPGLRHVALYHSSDGARGRGLLGLLTPTTGRCLLVVVVPGGLAAKEVTQAALERCWREVLAGMSEQGLLDEEQASALGGVSFSVEYASEYLVGLRTLQRGLGAYREAARGRAYPALQWQLRAARRALAALAAAGPWLRDRAALTRYAHVPLGALGRDALMSIADTLFARRLRAARHVLWAADPALPDLGVEALAEDDLFTLDEPPSPQVARPGCYRCVCVQLKLHHLAVAAVDQAPALAEAAGAVTLEGLLGPAARAWLDDATRNGSVIADGLLKQLYHWVSNPGAATHHPLLHRALLGLMQRLWVLLVDEVSRLGAHVVSASFGGIIIATNKRNLTAAGAHAAARRGAAALPAEAPTRPVARPGSERRAAPRCVCAVGYARYLLDTLAKRDSLGWLTLVPQRWWAALHYAATSGAWWSSCPARCKQHLVLLLAEWMYLPWQAANRAAAVARGATQGGSQAVLDARQGEAVQLEYLRDALAGRWGEKVMTRVSGVLRHVPAGSSHPDCVFPQRAGSHLTEAELGSPALAFVKTLGRLKEYALQDLACVQCKQVTASRLCSHCPTCGGALAASIKPDAAAKRLVVFRSLAAFHGFALLQQLADMALGAGGAHRRRVTARRPPAARAGAGARRARSCNRN
ncbi:POL2A [Scenedesmus sp. PABB004]|nr:POL2A [Scenedesmus sp. PABB004]